MISRIVLVALALATALAAAGCGSSDAAGGRTRVVAAFYPLAFAAEQVGGRGVSVTNLTPAGAEPHDVELTASAVRDVLDADLVVYLGDGFQPALEEAVADRDGRSLDVLAGLSLLTGADRGNDPDPHVWLDPARYRRIVEAVARALGRPEAARPLAQRLGRLDADYRRGLADCARREIVTSHAAFGYLAARYGLRQLPLTGITPEAEPSPRDLERLVDEVRRAGATTVFFETLVSPRLAETVARETGAATAVLDPLEGLTTDQAARGQDYLAVMRANLAALRKALGCR